MQGLFKLCKLLRFSWTGWPRPDLVAQRREPLCVLLAFHAHGPHLLDQAPLLVQTAELSGLLRRCAKSAIDVLAQLDDGLVQIGAHIWRSPELLLLLV